MKAEEASQEYSRRHASILVPLARKLEIHIQENLSELPRIDRICARAKSPESFAKKAAKKKGAKQRYARPLSQIQDQLGARVVALYLEDVAAACIEIERYYTPIESKDVVPDSPDEFGYTGKHYILFVPEELLPDEANLSIYPQFFELQVKTVFQHAWGEAGHDLVYKATGQLTEHQKRQVAFTAAQSWGADVIFSDLFKALVDAR